MAFAVYGFAQVGFTLGDLLTKKLCHIAMVQMWLLNAHRLFGEQHVVVTKVHVQLQASLCCNKICVRDCSSCHGMFQCLGTCRA